MSYTSCPIPTGYVSVSCYGSDDCCCYYDSAQYKPYCCACTDYSDYTLVQIIIGIVVIIIILICMWLCGCKLQGRKDGPNYQRFQDHKTRVVRTNRPIR